MRTTRILFNQIDFLDNTFCISPDNSPEAPPALTESIRRAGILHLPILKANQDSPYQIVCGRKRLSASQNISGNMGCDCMVISHDTADIDVLAVALEEAVQTKTLTCAREGIFFQKALSMIDAKAAAERFHPVLGRSPNRYAIEQQIILVNLEEPLLLALDKGFLDEKVARDMLKMPFIDRMSLFEIIELLKLSIGNQKKITATCQELSKRNKTTIMAIFSAPDIRDIMENPEMNPPQKCAQLMIKLTEKRFPHLHDAENEFKEFTKKLHLPEEITLEHSPSFESDKVILNIHFKTRENLLKTWENMKSIISPLPDPIKNDI